MAKYWCFTINNPETEPVFDPETMQYLLFGRETGESGTPHLQGYVVFKTRKRLTALKKIWPTAHFEHAKGTPDHNYAYCTKDGDFAEFGEKPVINQGKRSDLEALHETIKTGAGLPAIAEEHFGSFCRYHKAIDRARELVQKPRNWAMEIIVAWGDTGTGKTRWAFETYPDAYFKDGSQWWDGYDGHETIIWDEFYGGTIKIAEFLRLTDRYPHRVPVKGGYRQFIPRRIIFTSNDEPDQWYAHLESQKPRVYAAFKRRITEVKHFT